jgi:hypothetical protein
MTNLVSRSWRVLTAVWLTIALSAPLLFFRGRTVPELQARSEATQTERKAATAFNPRRVVPPFPAIRNAPFLPADNVSGEVTDNELVLGIVVDKAARAYPINMLTGPRREIINDTLGGRAIAATW